MSGNLERGILLYEQSRHELALEQFQLALAANPQDALAHAFVGLCLAEKEQYAAASDAAARAVQAAPDLSFPHYVAARVFHDRNRYPEAERAITEAIRLDPSSALSRGQAAAIRFSQSDWQGALNQATKGLEIDPENDLCSNIRAMALQKLGHVGHARTELQTSLERDPENSLTHANLGWAALERGQRDQALESFREALRIDPNLNWAREGMIHALKLRYPLYSLFLGYLLRMQRLSGRAQMGVLIAGYFGVRVLRTLARQSPQLRPWLMPLIIAYIGFAYLTWVARPLSNLVLRLNRFGRAILNPEERRESNLVTIALAGCLVSGVTFYLTDRLAALLGLVVCAALVIPLSTIYQCERGWPRTTLTAFTVLMMLVGGGAIIAVAVTGRLEGTGVVLASLFGLAAIAVPWLANGLNLARPKK